MKNTLTPYLNIAAGKSPSAVAKREGPLPPSQINLGGKITYYQVEPLITIYYHI